jgi:hypothetical protein
MGVHDDDDIPPFIINLNSDSSDSESDRSTDLDEPSTSNLRTSVDSESYGEEVTFMIVKCQNIFFFSNRNTCFFL